MYITCYVVQNLKMNVWLFYYVVKWGLSDVRSLKNVPGKKKKYLSTTGWHDRAKPAVI